MVGNGPQNQGEEVSMTRKSLHIWLLKKSVNRLRMEKTASSATGPQTLILSFIFLVGCHQLTEALGLSRLLTFFDVQDNLYFLLAHRNRGSQEPN